MIELHNFKKYKVKTVIKLLVRWLNYTILKYKVISSSQRPLPDNTQLSQQTNIHAPGGIRIQDLSNM